MAISASRDDVAALLGEAVEDVFVGENAKRQRSPHSWSMSGLEGCTRQNAYKVARWVVDRDWAEFVDNSRQGTLGTILHEKLLPALQVRLRGALIEHPVVLRAAGVDVPGQLDLYVNVTIGGKVYAFVLDLKTVGEHKLQGVRQHGPYSNHRAQVRGYAVAAQQAGMRVDYVAFLYLDRASGTQEIVIEPFTLDAAYVAAAAVLDRVAEVVRWSATPDQAPRDGRGPGKSIACDECPFLKSCWGPTAVRQEVGAQRILQFEDPGVEGLIQMFKDASAVKSQAEARYEFAKEALKGTRPGRYGSWEYEGISERKPETDPWGAVRMLEELGLPVPTYTKAGSHRIKAFKVVPPAKAKQSKVAVRDEDIPD